MKKRRRNLSDRYMQLSSCLLGYITCLSEIVPLHNWTK